MLSFLYSILPNWTACILLRFIIIFRDFKKGERSKFTMVFQRIWDENCPRVWDSWDGGDDVKWVIRDLRPSEDEEALHFVLEHFLPDEAFCYEAGIANETVSTELATIAWRKYISQRMSIACFEEKGDTRKLVALNVCLVHCQDHKPEFMVGGTARMKAVNALILLGNKVDVCEVLDVDTYLHSVCLVVHRNYRGARFGSRILAAGERLGLHHHINAFVGEFTSSIAQKVAKNLGYRTVASITFKEAGLGCSNDENKSAHLMVKKIVQDDDK